MSESDSYVHKQKTRLRTLAVALTLGVAALAAVPAPAQRAHCAACTERAAELMQKTAAGGGSFGERCLAAAKELAGTPYGANGDNDEEGTIMVNLHEFDRMGFANNVMAIAYGSMKTAPRGEEYASYLERYSRKKGEDKGFTSQYLYGADWVVDNVYRGNLKEMTEYLPGGGFKVKTLDYVSHHPEEYPALKDSTVYDKVKMTEMGYRSHRIPHMKKQSAGNRQLHELMENGDIIMMLTNEMDRDVYDIGFVEMRGGEPYLIHISHESGKVEEDPYPLSRLFKIDNQRFYGFRWLRPAE